MTFELGKGGRSEAFEVVDENGLLLMRNGLLELTKFSKSGVVPQARASLQLEESEDAHTYQISKKVLLHVTGKSLELIKVADNKFSRVPISTSPKSISYVDFNEDSLAVSY